ncbi:MAG: DNA polymerase III subunit beta [Bacteroides sp.]|nr:MAG: DNA polymerase III subunit beta [Bacteroides sp.]
MQFQINSDFFYESLKNNNNLIKFNNIYPILENFLIIIENNKLKITSSDGDLYMYTNIIIDNNNNFQCNFVINAKILINTLKTISDQNIFFKIYDKYIKIQSLTSVYKISISSGSEYPQLPNLDFNKFVNLNINEVKEIINSILLTVAKDELRPSMTGILLETSHEYLNFVSTDGHRLTKLTLKKGSVNNPRSFIIPIKLFNILKYQNKEEINNIDLFFNDKFLQIKTSNNTIISKLIDEQFPNYNAVIPSNNDKEIIINKSQILNALKRGFIYSDKINYQINFKITKNCIKISSEDQNCLNTYNEILKCDYVKNDIIEIGFNVKYLIEMINVIDDCNISIKISSNNNAVLLMPSIQKKDMTLIMIIMPLVL